MTTQEMKCILTLAATLSFTKAALEMNMTQPAFSRMIARAEEELGFKLFLRNTRVVELSREGKIFVLSLQRAFEFYQAGIEHAQSTSREGQSLNICCTAEFICQILAPYVLQFRKAHPNLFVECTPVQRETIPWLLRSGQSDLSFIFAAGENIHSDFSFEIIKRVPMHLIVNRENPLAQKETLEPADLKTENIIVYATNVDAYEIGSCGTPLFALNKKFGLNLRESEAVPSTQELLLRVACGYGICFFASFLEYMVPLNCVMRAVDWLDFNFIALWKGKQPSKYARMFLNFMQKDGG